MKKLTEFIELSELEMQQVRGGDAEALPVLKNDELGSYYEWPDGTWVDADGLA